MTTQEETTEQNNNFADRIVYRHMIYSMAAGAIPIPLVDIAAVTANQVDMIRQLAEQYSVEYSKDMGKSIATSITGATFAKAGASVIKTIPGVGTWLGITAQVLLAGSSTYALGQIFKNHFSQDNGLFDIDPDEMKQRYEEYLEKGKIVAQELKAKFKKNNDLETLDKLYQLKEAGAISVEEYEATKKSVLDKIAEQESQEQ
ncbi:MAG: YcjF family protein [Spirochaetota bacterium]